MSSEMSGPTYWCILIEGALGYHVNDSATLDPVGPFVEREEAARALTDAGWKRNVFELCGEETESWNAPEGFGEAEAGWQAHIRPIKAEIPTSNDFHVYG